MASWIDILSLLVTIGVLGGTAWGIVYAVKQVTESFQMTKQKCVQSVLADDRCFRTLIYHFSLYRMKDKGYELSGKGVSIKTSKRFDRQDYIDATQRNMIKTMTATSFNRRPDSQSPNSSTQATSSFAARPVIVDRAGGKKSAFGSLRKNTT
ncbi:hypothetical protein Ac2012v2_007922 [Leucoagaricus gongylophorus]